MDATPSKQMMLYFHWFHTLHESSRWAGDAWNKWPALLAYMRLYTMNRMALVSRSWRNALNAVLDSKVEVPSCIFQWQRAKYKFPKDIGIEKMTSVYMFRGLKAASFDRDCDIASCMMKWKPRDARRGSHKKLFSTVLKGGRLMRVENVVSSPANMGASRGGWLGGGNTASNPCVREPTTPLPRSFSVSAVEGELRWS